MKNLFAFLLLLVTSQAFSQEKSDCGEQTMLYWKVFDNTRQQGVKYNERSLQAATELCCIFSEINL